MGNAEESQHHVVGEGEDHEIFRVDEDDNRTHRPLQHTAERARAVFTSLNSLRASRDTLLKPISFPEHVVTFLTYPPPPLVSSVPTHHKPPQMLFVLLVVPDALNS